MDSKLNLWVMGQIELKLFTNWQKFKNSVEKGIGEGVEPQKYPSSAGKSLHWYSYSKEHFVNI